MTKNKLLQFLDDYIVWIVAAMVGICALLVSCNPVKRVLKDPFKTQQVFDEGVKLGWCVNDTVTISESDTLITFDTIYVEEIDTTDTGYKIDPNFYTIPPVVKSKIVTKTVKIRDTLTKVITDNSRINLLQKQLIKKDGEIIELDNKVKVANAETKQARKERNKWRLWFFLLLSGFGVYLFRKPLLKLIKPI